MESTINNSVVTHPTHNQSRRWRDRVDRPLRFIVVGLASAGTQLLILDSLLDLGWQELWANSVALIVAINVNFILNSLFTWRDHPATTYLRHWQRWGRFIAMQSGTLLLNQGIFLLALNWIPALEAAMTGSLLIASVNYLFGNRFIFLS